MTNKTRYTYNEVVTRSYYDNLKTNYFISERGFIYERIDDFGYHFPELIGNIYFDIKNKYEYDDSESYYPIENLNDYNFIKREITEQHIDYCYKPQEIEIHDDGLDINDVFKNISTTETRYFYESHGFIFKFEYKEQYEYPEVKMIAHIDFDINEYKKAVEEWFGIDEECMLFKEIKLYKESSK